MKPNLRQNKLLLLLGLLALSGLTAYGYRASGPWRSAAKVKAPRTPLVSAVSHAELSPETEMEPAQSGGGYNVTQSVIAGGGGVSANGNTRLEGSLGQSATTTSNGGRYTLSGGFF